MRVLIGVVLAIAGCGGISDPPSSEGPRVISLSPGITYTMVDLGLANTLVGRSTFCDAAGKDVAIVGDLSSIDFERIVRLAPTHVFVQETVRGHHRHLEELAAQRGFTLHAWPLDGLGDIERIVVELPQMLGADVGDLSAQLAAALAPQEHLGGATALLLAPGRLAFGRGTWIDEVWTRMGGCNALEAGGWQTLSLEDLARLAPDRIVVISNAPIDPTELAQLHALPVPAARGGQIDTIIFPGALLPSTSVIRTVDALAALGGRR